MITHHNSHKNNPQETLLQNTIPKEAQLSVEEKELKK